MKRRFILACLLFLIAITFSACQNQQDRPARRKGLQVVTTLFPLYDFARNIGQDRVDVSLLLPPGVEPHGYEPKPRDILRIHNADVFVYTGPFMEPWAASIIKGSQKQNLVVVDSSSGVLLRHEAEDDGADNEHHQHGHVHSNHSKAEPVDPHIWLDLGNAGKMVDNITTAFIKKDPEAKAFYERNTAAYKTRLQRLDNNFSNGLENCRTRLFVHGGHYAFNYLARRYNLTYVSVYGFSPNAEPSPKHLADIIQKIRRSRAKYVFYEELIQPRIAETIAQETGAKLLPLNGGHNVTSEEMEKGITFISLLEQDLTNLRTGLQCR